eukprot:RCo055759
MHPGSQTDAEPETGFNLCVATAHGTFVCICGGTRVCLQPFFSFLWGICSYVSVVVVSLPPSFAPLSACLLAPAGWEGNGFSERVSGQPLLEIPPTGFVTHRQSIALFLANCSSSSNSFCCMQPNSHTTLLDPPRFCFAFLFATQPLISRYVFCFCFWNACGIGCTLWVMAVQSTSYSSRNRCENVPSSLLVPSVAHHKARCYCVTHVTVRFPITFCTYFYSQPRFPLRRSSVDVSFCGECCARAAPLSFFGSFLGNNCFRKAVPVPSGGYIGMHRCDSCCRSPSHLTSPHISPIPIPVPTNV